MQDQLHRIIVVLAILFSVPMENFASNEFETHKYVGFIAFERAILIDDNTQSEPTNCPCNGTGRVKSGDGILLIPCPCGDSCKCSKNNTNPDNSLENTSQWSKRVLFLSFKNCPPCNKWKKDEKPKLVNRSKDPWDYGTTPQNLIQEIDIETPDGEKYVERYDTSTYPTFIIVDKQGKELARQEGFITAQELGDLYYGAK